ncbi:site-specific integrase [Runella rosea]|jgi:integrase/recombinase XerD|uniref:Site-specific integrase n=1 Tax=Runella rosea TaxID=2259595 RepID=A0A344TGT1_9BACT|nr:site-specific integrase [Runella rosea]AXE17852.1 site-specific integrase [Runella rosea]
MTSAKVILFTSKVLKNDEHPVMLRLIQNRKIKYLNLGFSCLASDWDDKTHLPKKKHPLYKEMAVAIGSITNRANREILNLENEGRIYSLEELAEILQVNKRKTTHTVFSYFEEIISRKIEAGKIGYSDTFKATLLKLKNYRRDKDLEFSDVTHAFITKYEEWLKRQSLEPNSIFLYLRTFNTALNYAKKDKLVKDDYTPFKEFSFSKYRRAKTKKRAISKEEMLRIAQFSPNAKSRLFHSRNYFMFSYYCGGINFVDMANLRWSNIQSGRLLYTRQKTGEDFNIILLPPTLHILEHYKQTYYLGEESFIFPILSDFHKTPKQISDRIHKVNGQTNDDLKEIGKLLEIGVPLTTYVARHSFATIQKKSGTPTSVISEMMGHDSERTTRIYLDSFGNDVLDEAMKALM